MLLKITKYPLIITAVAIIATLILAGPAAALIVGILAILEISLSFDNAVVNAKVLGKMNPYWQKIFLTVGIAIAVFGMRLVFPIIVVALAANLDPASVIGMALSNPSDYAHHLREAHPSIAAFGGMFLLLIFLDFMFEDRDIKWLKPIEELLAKAGKLDYLSIIIALSVLGVSASTFAHEHAASVLLSGVFGIITYLLVNGLSSLFEVGEGAKQAVKAGFFSFLYLEVLDASFSFDGVIGAFAISDEVLVIAVGLGLGALFIRSLTVYLVRAGKLSEYHYLEHGAHWAIGSLAILLIVGIAHEVPEVVTGLIGVAFIGAAFGQSIFENKRGRGHGDINASSSIS